MLPETGMLAYCVSRYEKFESISLQARSRQRIHSAIFNSLFWLLWVLTLSAVLLGSSAGVALYRRISEVNFRRAVRIGQQSR